MTHKSQFRYFGCLSAFDGDLSNYFFLFSPDSVTSRFQVNWNLVGSFEINLESRKRKLVKTWETSFDFELIATLQKRYDNASVGLKRSEY